MMNLDQTTLWAPTIYPSVTATLSTRVEENLGRLLDSREEMWKVIRNSEKCRTISEYR